MAGVEDGVDELGDGKREYGVLVVFESERLEYFFGAGFRGEVECFVVASALDDAVEGRVEVVVSDQECSLVGVLLIVLVDALADEHADGRFAAAFFAEYDGGARLVDPAKNFGEIRVCGGGFDEPAIDGVVAGFFGFKGVFFDAVMR